MPGSRRPQQRPRGEFIRTHGLVLLAGVICLALAPAINAQEAAKTNQSAPTMRAPGLASSLRPPLLPPKPGSVVDYRHGHSVGTDLFMGWLEFYRTVVSAVDGDRCSMAPTCSLYSHQALREHGVLLGILLTADRLIHEADSPAFASRVRIDGDTYYLDSLEDNTYWIGGK